MILESGILEVMMLLCFAAAWPVSILKSYRARTAQGKSLAFMLILEIGYILGIANKFAIDMVNYIIAFYFINLILVGIDVILWFKNNNIDRQKSKGRDKNES